MVDTLAEDDIARVDSHVDPTATTADEIESSLNDDFDGESRDAFADALADRRAPVREEGRELMHKRITRNPSSGDLMIRNDKGQFATNADAVSGSYVADSGDVMASVSGGEDVRLGSVDLSAGSESGSRDSAYSK